MGALRFAPIPSVRIVTVLFLDGAYLHDLSDAGMCSILSFRSQTLKPYFDVQIASNQILDSGTYDNKSIMDAHFASLEHNWAGRSLWTLVLDR